MNSHNPVAIITGAARGIGRGIAGALAKEGYDIAGVDIAFDPDVENDHAVQNEIEDAGTCFHPVSGDIGNLDDHARIVDAILDRFDRIDVLVNNAGVAPLERLDILKTTADSYDRVQSINARGPFFLTQRIANVLIQQTDKIENYRPCIIFISSISADVSSPSRAEYCISKAAMSMMATVYADRLAEYGIHVYEIRPGIIKTDMTMPVREKYDALIEGGLVPQKRWGTPEDIGKAVASLVRGDFDYATGIVLELSGGMNIRHL